MWDGYGMGFGWMWLLWFFVVVGIGLLIYVVVRLTSGGQGHGPGPAGQIQAPGPIAPPAGGTHVSGARAILEERYARGEIDTAEFQERLRALEGR